MTALGDGVATLFTDPPPVRLPVLSTTAVRKYRACPRSFLYEQEMGYRPAFVDQARGFGTRWHGGLENYWNAAMSGLPRVAWLDSALAAVLGEEDHFERSKLETLLVGYDARWGDADAERWEVLGVETEFVGPLINPATGAESRTWRLGGKLDVLVRERATGRVYIIEHKTSSEDVTPGSDYWVRLTLDSQVSNYLTGARWLAARHGFDASAIAGVIYDVVAKPGQRPLRATPEESRKYTREGKLYANQRERDETPAEYRARLMDAIGENPERYFARGEIVRLDDEVREAAQDLWQTAGQIRDARRLKVWPRNPDACNRYGRTCEFLPVCLGTGSLDDATRYRRAERANEELSV